MKYSPEQTAEILARARELVSPEARAAADAAYGEWLARHDADELLNHETDTLLARLEKTQEPDFKLIYKDYDPARRESSTIMDAEHQRLWNEWARGHITRALGDFAGLMGTEVGAIDRELRAEIERLNGEVAALRADLNVVRAIHSGEVATLKEKTKNVA